MREAGARRRPLFRENLCCIVGSVFILGCAIPGASLFFFGGGNASHDPSSFLMHYVAQNSALRLSNQGRSEADVAAAECRATLLKCEADALQRKRAAEQRDDRPKKAPPKVFVGVNGGKNLAPLSNKKMGWDCKVNDSPFASMVPFYPNDALKNAMQMHDRWVVEGLAFINSFDLGQNEAYQHHHHRSQSPGSGSDSGSKPITLIILTVSRTVPYLAVLVATLLKGNDPAMLGQFVDLHIVNIERRPCRCSYPLLSDLERKLPFVTFHDWRKPYPQHLNITNPKRMYMSNQRLDYIRALELCAEKKGSDWCLVLEDDAILTANVINKFRKLVLTAADLNVANLAVLALYVPYNDRWSDMNRITMGSYAKERYNEDAKALKYMDPDTLDGPKPRLRYRIEGLNRTYGAVANAYPFAVLGRMIEFLSRDDSRTSEYTDVAIMNNFVKESGLERLGVSPSLVNHLGHYSEHRPDVNKMDDVSADERCKSKLFREMSLDVRFQLEDGWDVGDGQ